MASCIDCIHFEVCKDYIESALKGLDYGIINFVSDGCKFVKDRARFVELPFEQNKGASPFDIVAHTTYEKGGIVILAQGTSPYDVIEKAKQAIEKLSKERENNAR